MPTFHRAASLLFLQMNLSLLVLKQLSCPSQGLIVHAHVQSHSKPEHKPESLAAGLVPASPAAGGFVVKAKPFHLGCHQHPVQKAHHVCVLAMPTPVSPDGQLLLYLLPAKLSLWVQSAEMALSFCDVHDKTLKIRIQQWQCLDVKHLRVCLHCVCKLQESRWEIKPTGPIVVELYIIEYI